MERVLDQRRVQARGLEDKARTRGRRVVRLLEVGPKQGAPLRALLGARRVEMARRLVYHRIVPIGVVREIGVDGHENALRILRRVDRH